MFDHFEKILKRYEELAEQMLDPKLTGDSARYAEVAREHGGLEKVARKYKTFKDLAGQIEEAEGICREESDPEMRRYAEGELARLVERRDALEAELQEVLLGGDAATRNSLILEIRAGTGGDEAALFAGDLYEMYRRLAERRGWKVEVLDARPTELGGFKEVILNVTGEGVLGELQFESGGHRVQRIPETETKGRRHTSAATVAVLPEPTEVEIDIKDDDLKIDTFRSSGPGGQHVNKTSSAVRITHLPSGLVVSCQDEKSQHKNRSKAMRILRSRLYDKRMQDERAQRDAQRRTLIGTGDRSQRIRTYNFPDNRVTDHRIGLSLYRLDSIIMGDMDELLDALRKFDREQRLGGNGKK
jgi:peptide chain release factor 1